MMRVFYDNRDQQNFTTNFSFGSTESCVVGFVYILLSVFYLLPYVLCMKIIYGDKKLMSKSYYNIVVHMGLTDMIQLVFNGIAGGVFTVLGGTGHFWVNKIFGGLMNFCWVIYCFLAHVLALNRFFHVYWPLDTKTVFSMRNTKLLIGAIWVYGFGWLMAYLCPSISVLYNLQTYCWDYDKTRMSRIAWTIELTNDCLHAAAMVVWYCLIFVKLKIKFTQLSNVQLNEDRREMRVLIQAFLVCLMVILTVVGFFAIPIMIPNRWATFAANIVWLTCAGNNAFVYYTFNSSIRKRALKFMKCSTYSPSNTQFEWELSRRRTKRNSSVSPEKWFREN